MILVKKMSLVILEFFLFDIVRQVRIQIYNRFTYIIGTYQSISIIYCCMPSHLHHHTTFLKQRPILNTHQSPRGQTVIDFFLYRYIHNLGKYITCKVWLTLCNVMMDNGNKLQTHDQISI